MRLFYSCRYIFSDLLINLIMLTKDLWLPTDDELTVEEVPLGTPSLRAGGDTSDIVYH